MPKRIPSRIWFFVDRDLRIHCNVFFNTDGDNWYSGLKLSDFWQNVWMVLIHSDSDTVIVILIGPPCLSRSFATCARIKRWSKCWCSLLSISNQRNIWFVTASKLAVSLSIYSFFRGGKRRTAAVLDYHSTNIRRVHGYFQFQPLKYKIKTKITATQE